MGSSSDSGIVLILRWGQYSEQGMAVIGALASFEAAEAWVAQAVSDETRDRVLRSMLDDVIARECPYRSEAADHWAQTVIRSPAGDVIPGDGDIDVQWYSASVPSRMLRSDLIELIPHEDDDLNLCGLTIRFTRDGGAK